MRDALDQVSSPPPRRWRRPRHRWRARSMPLRACQLELGCGPGASPLELAVALTGGLLHGRPRDPAHVSRSCPVVRDSSRPDVCLPSVAMHSAPVYDRPARTGPDAPGRAKACPRSWSDIDLCHRVPRARKI